MRKIIETLTNFRYNKDVEKFIEMCLKTNFLNCHPCMFGAAKIAAEGNVKGTVRGTIRDCEGNC